MAQPNATKTWTYADYLALPDDGKQHQIIGGRHFVTAAPRTLAEETHVPLAPDLAIEVLSPSTRKLDLELKRALYERHRVREYWIVDPRLETVQRLRLAGDGFEELELSSRDSADVIRSSVLEGLEAALGSTRVTSRSTASRWRPPYPSPSGFLDCSLNRPASRSALRST